MSLSQNIEVLNDPLVRKEVYDRAIEKGAGDYGDFTIAHVHAVMESLVEVVSRDDD